MRYLGLSNMSAPMRHFNTPNSLMTTPVMLVFFFFTSVLGLPAFITQRLKSLRAETKQHQVAYDKGLQSWIKIYDVKVALDCTTYDQVGEFMENSQRAAVQFKMVLIDACKANLTTEGFQQCSNIARMLHSHDSPSIMELDFMSRKASKTTSSSSSVSRMLLEKMLNIRVLSKEQNIPMQLLSLDMLELFLAYQLEPAASKSLVLKVYRERFLQVLQYDVYRFVQKITKIRRGMEHLPFKCERPWEAPMVQMGSLGNLLTDVFPDSSHYIVSPVAIENFVDLVKCLMEKLEAEQVDIPNASFMQLWQAYFRVSYLRGFIALLRCGHLEMQHSTAYLSFYELEKLKGDVFDAVNVRLGSLQNQLPSDLKQYALSTADFVLKNQNGFKMHLENAIVKWYPLEYVPVRHFHVTYDPVSHTLIFFIMGLSQECTERLLSTNHFETCLKRIINKMCIYTDLEASKKFTSYINAKLNNLQ